MTEKEGKEVKDGVRNLVDKIGTSGEGFSVFLGAGASKTVDLPTMKELADSLEQELSKTDNDALSKLINEVIAVLKSEHPNGITIEQVLDMLYHVHFLIENRESRISFSLGQLQNVDTSLLNSSIDFIKDIIWKRCYSIDPAKLKTHAAFLQCFMGAPGRIRALDIFTTNWDFAIEMTCDELKFRCVDGFIGTFNGFERFSVFTESRGEQLRTVYLHKLHGSLNWILEQTSGELRKRVNWHEIDSSSPKRFMIFPVPSKSKEILGYPYADLISAFSDALLRRTHPLLLVIGYNFSDSHIVSKISSMLQNNEHSNLFIVDPNLKQATVSEAIGFDIEHDARVTLLPISFAQFTDVLKELTVYE